MEIENKEKTERPDLVPRKSILRSRLKYGASRPLSTGLGVSFEKTNSFQDTKGSLMTATHNTNFMSKNHKFVTSEANISHSKEDELSVGQPKEYARKHDSRGATRPPQSINGLTVKPREATQFRNHLVNYFQKVFTKKEIVSDSKGSISQFEGAKQKSRTVDANKLDLQERLKLGTKKDNSKSYDGGLAKTKTLSLEKGSKSIRPNGKGFVGDSSQPSVEKSIEKSFRVRKTVTSMGVSQSSVRRPDEEERLEQRRMAMLDAFIEKGGKLMSVKMENFYAKFKKSMFNIETDINRNIPFDLTALPNFNEIPFFEGGRIIRVGYLENLKTTFNKLMNHFREFQSQNISKSGVHETSKESSKSDSISILNHDPIFVLIRKIENLETILIFLFLYAWILHHFGFPQKAEILANMLLSLSYVYDKWRYKVESYLLLGTIHESKLHTELALLCYTRAMQMSWESGDRSSEKYYCDKIGFQLYNMNEMRLAYFFHRRMMTDWVEPAASNAIIRSHDILAFEKHRFSEEFYCKEGSLLEKYMAFSRLLQSESFPFVEMLVVEKDDKDNPVMLNFIELIIQKQIENDEDNQKATNFSFLTNTFYARMAHSLRMKDKESELKVDFTNEGDKVMKEMNEFIPQISHKLNALDIKPKMRLTHQKNVNILMNYLNFNHHSRAKTDHEHLRTKKQELQRKKVLDETVAFCNKAKYFSAQKLSEITGEDNCKAHRGKRLKVVNKFKDYRAPLAF